MKEYSGPNRVPHSLYDGSPHRRTGSTPWLCSVSILHICSGTIPCRRHIGPWVNHHPVLGTCSKQPCSLLPVTLFKGGFELSSIRITYTAGAILHRKYALSEFHQCANAPTKMLHKVARLCTLHNIDDMGFPLSAVLVGLQEVGRLNL